MSMSMLRMSMRVKMLLLLRHMVRLDRADLRWGMFVFVVTQAGDENRGMVGLSLWVRRCMYVCLMR